ncbi:MAG: zf-HC2 domain-containing protein [Gemmatimonadaceae bacterium]|nr:zf-HC2 domain-containing protein [Gemmatimonadaceae bacterium]
MDDCRAVVQRLWDFLDQELDAPTMAAIEHHVMACSGCAAHVAFARTFLEAVRSVSRSRTSQEDQHTRMLRTMVMNRLADAGFHPPPSETSA